MSRGRLYSQRDLIVAIGGLNDEENDYNRHISCNNDDFYKL